VPGGEPRSRGSRSCNSGRKDLSQHPQTSRTKREPTGYIPAAQLDRAYELIRRNFPSQTAALLEVLAVHNVFAVRCSWRTLSRLMRGPPWL
jgi:hypothetical protein